VEFMELLEQARGGIDDVGRIFGAGDDGRMVRDARRAANPRYRAHLAEAVGFLADVVEGKRPWQLREAMTTSDFPILFGDVLDRSVLAAYREYPSTWDRLAGRRVVNDFRDVKMYPPPIGADTVLPEVKEQVEYPAAKLDEQAAKSFRVVKRGRRVPFSWEAMVNDDLDQLKDVPRRLGVAARRSEHRFVAELYVGASGPNTTLYSNGNKNIINTTNGALATNPPLSIAGLQDAFRVLSLMVDEQGEPIFVEGVTLVVPPALEITARNILNATTIEATSLPAGGAPPNPATAGEQRLVINNWMRNRVELVIDPYIPAIATTANGNTSWFLFANPSVGRPALLMGFLRGHEQPEIWIKEPNARRAGGGAIDPMEGDFDTDSIQYRVRHVFGGLQVDPKATVMSNGSGA
jgi:hypothetical protein